MQQVYSYTRINGVTKIRDGVSFCESYIVPSEKFGEFYDSMDQKYGKGWAKEFTCEERLDGEDNYFFEYYRYNYSEPTSLEKTVSSWYEKLDEVINS